MRYAWLNTLKEIGTWTVEDVRRLGGFVDAQLSDGTVLPGRILGRQNKVATLAVRVHDMELRTKVPWEELVHAINDDAPMVLG